MASTTSLNSIPVPGQNVNSKPFTSQLTRANALPQQPPMNANNNAVGTPRFPGMNFNPALPPNSMPQPQGFNKFTSFPTMQQPGELTAHSCNQT